MSSQLLSSLLLSSCVCASLVCTGQDKAPLDLVFYADVMSNAAYADHRMFAAEQFDAQFRDLVAKGNYADAVIDSLSGVQRLYSPDSAFAILTWGVERSDGKYTYSGLIADREGIRVALEDKRSLGSEFADHTHTTWYGALYYGMYPFAMPGGENAYVLLGFDANDPVTNKRVADILVLENGRAQFGLPVFTPVNGIPEDEPKSRVVIEYADAAMGTMQFDRSRNMLLYDNIIFVNSGQEGPLPVPDGSYRAYEFKDGTWQYVDKVFDLILDKPPGEGLPASDRDIMGRKKN